MSMIFHGFANMTKAKQFATAVKERFGLNGQAFDGDKAYEHDVSPWVYVDRVDCYHRADIAAIKKRFGLTAQDVKAKGIYCAEVRTMVAAEYQVKNLVKKYGGRFMAT